MDALNDLLLSAVSSPWLYAVMFAVAVIDGFFPPMPSETVLVAAAAIAGSTGTIDVALLCIAAAAGAAVGDNIAYGLGRSIGTTRARWMRRPRVEVAFDRARLALSRRGALLILGARYIPVGRVAVNMSSGGLGYPWHRFLPLSLIGGVTWALYSVAIGMLAGTLFEGQPFLGSALGVALALAIGLSVDRLLAARRRRASDRTPRRSRSSEPARVGE